MSDNDEVQYWRILLNSPNAEPGKHIKRGDEIRLCWNFKDQTTGWRDYADDVFGRRRNDIPSGMDETTTLFLKLPFPRFETYRNEDVPPVHSMIMAPIKSTDPQYYTIDILTKDGKNNERVAYYKMQDVVFRVDPVPNMGFGDSEDYMMRDIKQARQQTIGGRSMINDRVFWL